MHLNNWKRQVWVVSSPAPTLVFTIRWASRHVLHVWSMHRLVKWRLGEARYNQIDCCSWLNERHSCMIRCLNPWTLRIEQCDTAHSSINRSPAQHSYQHGRYGLCWPNAIQVVGKLIWRILPRHLETSNWTWHVSKTGKHIVQLRLRVSKRFSLGLSLSRGRYVVPKIVVTKSA